MYFLLKYERERNIVVWRILSLSFFVYVILILVCLRVFYKLIYLEFLIFMIFFSFVVFVGDFLNFVNTDIINFNCII